MYHTDKYNFSATESFLSQCQRVVKNGYYDNLPLNKKHYLKANVCLLSVPYFMVSHILFENSHTLYYNTRYDCYGFI